MNSTLFIGVLLLLTSGGMPAFGEDSLLYETWRRSLSEPTRLDEFLRTHRAEYNDDYFSCSKEAQRLIRDEANIRDRRCDFSGDSVQRNSCRKDNFFRGLDTHLSDLDQAIRSHTPWLDLESGRHAQAALQDAEQFQKTCSPAACDIAKKNKSRLLQELKPYLQCPPAVEPGGNVDPSFKTFQLPEDPGG